MDCPVDALSIGPLGQVVASPTLCNLCGKCRRNCPIGAIDIFDDIVYVCDLCGGSPKCVDACTEGAIIFEPGDSETVSLADIKENIKSDPVKKKMNAGEKRADYIDKQGQALLKKWRG